MATVQLHTAHTLSPVSTVAQALLQALQHCGQELQAAFEGADRTRAAALGAQVLQHTATACAAQMRVPATAALVQALVLEVAYQPLTAQADGTLVADRFDVWIDHRAWQVAPATRPALFDQLLASLHAASGEVAWSYQLTSQGRAAIQAWAPLAT